MKERPILFRGSMVKAILDGRKTQTRRVVKPQPDGVTAGGIPYRHVSHQVVDEVKRITYTITHTPNGSPYIERIKCPYGTPGDRLWVRRKPDLSFAWKKADAFLWLEITNVRVERLQDISGADCGAEGIVPNGDPNWHRDLVGGVHAEVRAIREAFADAWDDTNGKKHPWSSNPWVWVIEFRRLIDV